MRAVTDLIPLDCTDVSLDDVGGKALNLGRLARAGYRVPRGVVVTTQAYRRFVQAHGLTEVIAAELADLDPTQPEALEQASSRIRRAFRSAAFPDDLASSLASTYAAWSTPQQPVAVAVRSSATAEDLPEHSFAGQQDSFLNVIGDAALRTAVVECWSSLWTARAIGYRLRNGIGNDQVQLAVVIQELVPAVVSGVMFTADPLTGRRDRTVIDATFGLGEALVSGQVEPDHVVLDSDRGSVLAYTRGRKAVRSVRAAGGGVETVPSPTSGEASLTDPQLAELVELGRSIQRDVGSPQDIEWAIDEAGQLWVLQSRAVTSLYPLPTSSANRLAVWISFGAIQGMLRPMTPLGQDAIRMLFSGGARIFGVTQRHGEVGVISPAGQRLWVRIDDVLRNPMGRKVAPLFLGQVEPSARSIVASLLDDEGLAPAPARTPGRGLGGAGKAVVGVAARILPRLVRNVVAPTTGRRHFDAAATEAVTAASRILQAIPATTDPLQRLTYRVDAMEKVLSDAFPRLVPHFAPLVAPSFVMLYRLRRVAAELGQEHLALEVTRSIPDNVTTQMDLALWDTAQALRRNPDDESPLVAFLARYGARGIAEIDLGQPRWRDDPRPLRLSIASYQQITDPELAPDAQFRRGAANADAAVAKLTTLARAAGKPGRAREIAFLARRIRIMLGARETPKFTVIQTFGDIRAALLASGEDLVAAGYLDHPSDVFYVSAEELRRHDNPSGWRDLVAERRLLAEREAGRRQIPRVILSDGRTFYEGVGSGQVDASTIVGTPVSPGVARGRVRVVFDPTTAHLQPGEVLVCPGTDPAWTPLFLTAAALVTEVGGLMTHGSVVAREYGIPAVVGVHDATSRLVTGQEVLIDGTTGTISIQ